MAYEYKLSISAINVNTNDLITDIAIAVKDGSNQNIDFDNLDFTVTDTASTPIVFTVDAANKKLNFTTPQANTIALLVKAADKSPGTNNTNILLVDFNQAFDSIGEATLSYTAPDESGNYTLAFKSTDGTSIPELTTPLIVNKNADATNSSITYEKSYLSKRISTVLGVRVTLKDADGNAVTGTDEVDLTAK